jgi:hypothetical protein
MNNPKRKMTPIQWFKLLLGIALVSPIAYYLAMITGDALLGFTGISWDDKPTSLLELSIPCIALIVGFYAAWKAFLLLPFIDQELLETINENNDDVFLAEAEASENPAEYYAKLQPFVLFLSWGLVSLMIAPGFQYLTDELSEYMKSIGQANSVFEIGLLIILIVTFLGLSIKLLNYVPWINEETKKAFLGKLYNKYSDEQE